MSCERMEGRILSYVDGRLKENERPEVEKHLATCASCQLRVEEFRAVSGLLDEQPVPWGGNPQVADEQMMQDLPVLEDHDLLSNFEPLKELPAPVQAEPVSDTQQEM